MSIKHYQRVLSLIPEAVMIVEVGGNILFVNDAAARLVQHDSLNNSCLFEELDDDKHEQTRIYLRQCARTNQPLVGVLSFKTRSDQQLLACYGALLEPRTADRKAILLLRLHPRNKSNIRFLTLQKQIEDLNKEMSKRLVAERALRNQTKRLEVTLASIGDAVIITDKFTSVTFLNPAAETMTGWSSQQAIGKQLSDIFNVVDEWTSLPVDNPAEKAIRKRAVVSYYNEVMLITKNGGRISVETTAAPIVYDNQIDGVIVVFHDVTEKRMLERQQIDRANHLELMNQRKNQFLTMLAHELRSPLTPISNAAQVMKLQSKSPTPFEEPRRIIERQVNHLKRLVDDMLDVSRINSGKMNIVRNTVDLVTIINAVCCDFKLQFNALEIACITDVPSTSVWIHADSDRITQVLYNLLNNALKFTPKGGKVTLSLSANEDVALIKISDNGIGISQSAIHELFEPFAQVEQALDRSSGGLGLGLSLVKGIVELHDGSVHASSDGQNRGTTICLSLPISVEGAISAVESTPNSPSISHRILLIEDDHDAANTMSQLLQLLGHEVCWSSTGYDGVKTAAKMIPTLIICDIGLPGLDGFAVVKRLRKAASTSAIPIVALTGYGETEFVNRAKEAGFDDHITKPASLDEIRAVLAISR